ncbi:DNA alkylation repair protein [Spirochaetota bacterium]
MKNNMASIEDVLKELKSNANPHQIKGMERFGMTSKGRLGVSIPDLRKMAKSIGKDHRLALELWESGFQEGRILAAMVAEPHRVTGKQMDMWVKDFDSWDVCDQVCMNLFDRTDIVWEKIGDWSKSGEEFIKRAAYALIASLALHNKEANDSKFVELFPLIKMGSTDDRNYVKKAVSWALRHIGKRNIKLNKSAIKLAYEIKKIDSKPARWIANDAIRELEGDSVQRRLKGS